MKRNIIFMGVVVILVSLLSIVIPTALSSALTAEPPPTSVNGQATADQVKQAILEAVATNERYTQGALVTNLQVAEVQLSQDQVWATAWVVYYDPQIEALLPTEPALAVARWDGARWRVALPTESGWQEAINSVPEDLLTKEEKDMWSAMNQGTEEAYPTQSGYFLPWQGGQTGYLSRSVGHDADYTTAHFAFDFFMPGTTICPPAGSPQGTTGLNFNILAARAGTVWGWDDSVANCDHSAVNFIVLQNLDDPTLFQLYMHLSQDSIPPALKMVGAPVARGQFIAVADNTGASTGSHLHFQIERQPYWPSANPYWAIALDFTFDDVDINGGRPRVNPPDEPYCKTTDVCDVFRQTYVSGNYYMGDSTPPTGDLSGVSTGVVVAAPTITLSGYGWDGQTGLDYGQLVAFFDGSWHNLGPHFNPDFTYTWDFCDPRAPVPDGAISVALRLYDIAGNPAPLVGLRHFTKNYSCPIPPPSCIPGASQVTLFEDSDFHGGCVLFSVGDYPNANALNPIGNNDVESMLVGGNVIATLFSDENFTGHSVAVAQDISYMQYSLVSADTLSSMRISARSGLPLAPSLVSPVNGTSLREGDVIPMSWQNGGGALDYRVEVYLNSNLIVSSPWQVDPFTYIDSFAQGAYTWRVQGRNTAGESPWSQSFNFTVASPVAAPPMVTAPYSDTMESTESSWTSNGEWTYMDNSTMAHSGTHSWWYQNNYGDYDNGQPNHGFLTSPPISITGIGYYLRFYYRYQTETRGTTWDQRWIQISVDGDPFTNFLQLHDDPQIPETSTWMRSPVIDLSTYAGHVIRLRFQFATMDASLNNFEGWGIDDFSITTNPPPDCSQARQDDTPADATLITYNPTSAYPDEICPGGDFDYYKFNGAWGDRVVADIDAMSNGSLLDSYLYLLDSDGVTVLAENDDEVYAERRDSLIGYTLPHDGVYYLKVRAWKHPLVGGDAYFYTLRFYEDHQDPIASITWPLGDSYLPDSAMTVMVNVSDVYNGVNRVEFYWHPMDWRSGLWEYLETDWDGTDGWTASFDPGGESEGVGAAFYVHAYDMAGNWVGAGAWNLGIDKIPPITGLQPLSPSQPSNAFMLAWTGTDNLSGIDFVEVQEKLNNGSWTTYPPIDGAYSNYWVVGEPGNTYAYRMHGVDRSGNAEAYPTSAETSTSLPEADFLCSQPDTYDSSGNDNSPANANPIIPGGASQTHNYCNPLGQDYQNDEDWVMFTAQYGKHYLIQSLPNSMATATVISLYAQDGTTLLAETRPNSFGDSTMLVWTSDRDGLVYIQLSHMDGRVIGNEVTYRVIVLEGYQTFLPLANR